MRSYFYPRTSRLPVIYVFGKKEIDVDDCVEKLLSTLQDVSDDAQTILLRMDVTYSHRAGK